MINRKFVCDIENVRNTHGTEAMDLWLENDRPVMRVKHEGGVYVEIDLLDLMKWLRANAKLGQKASVISILANIEK